MKKLLILPIMAILSLVVSCSSNDDTPEPPVTMNEVFYGNLLFNGSSIADDAKCTLDIVGDSASVTLHGVTFAPTMPAMDIVIPGLECVKNSNDYVLSGKNIVPTVMGMPMEKYMITSVEALWADDVFVVSAAMSMGTIGFSNAMLNIKPVGGEAKSYKGNLLVGDFTKEAVVKITMNENEGSLDLVIEGAKFAANMPLELDITLKEIPYLVNDGTVSFSAEDVAPYINAENEPVPAYKFAIVEGTVQGSKLLLDAKMADDLAAYVAGMEFVFEGTEIVE